jgi:hypothetical protein
MKKREEEEREKRKTFQLKKEVSADLSWGKFSVGG